MNKLVRKTLYGCFLIFSLMLLVGCSKKVTVEDLKENDWLIASTVEDEPNMIASFSNSTVTMKIDVKSMESSAENEWEELGEEFAKSLVDLMQFTFEYTLEGKNITLLDIETGDSSEFIVSREEDNIIFTPVDKNDEDLEVLTLTPYIQEDTTDQSSSSQSDSESTSSADIQSDTKEISTSVSLQLNTEDSISNIATESSFQPTPIGSLADFVGGWGIPHTEELFFINSDSTFSNPATSNAPLSNPLFGATDDGRFTMTLHFDNGITSEFILETDGTLTTNGYIYYPLGYNTIEEFRARPDGQPPKENPEYVQNFDSPAAIEIAKQFMAGDNDISITDSYSFMDDSGILYDDSSRPYFSIRIRQNAQGDFQSMAIGNVTVYADTGECFWQ